MDAPYGFRVLREVGGDARQIRGRADSAGERAVEVEADQAARRLTAKDTNEKLVHRRLTVLEPAERLGNVSWNKPGRATMASGWCRCLRH